MSSFISEQIIATPSATPNYSAISTTEIYQENTPCEHLCFLKKWLSKYYQNRTFVPPYVTLSII